MSAVDFKALGAVVRPPNYEDRVHMNEDETKTDSDTILQSSELFLNRTL